MFTCVDEFGPHEDHTSREHNCWMMLGQMVNDDTVLTLSDDGLVTGLELTTAIPSEVDTALAEIYIRLYRVWDAQNQNDKHIKDYQRGLERLAKGDLSYSGWSQDRLDLLTDKRADLEDDAKAIVRETQPYEAEYRSRPWTRFYLVNNNGGHIHSSMSCNTCFPTTRFGWLPEVSGQTEAEAVAAHGAILCTVCYPSAPTEWTMGKVDPDVCEDSGQGYDSSLPHRSGYYTGNWATCSACGGRPALTKSFTLRKHKRGYGKPE